MRARAAGGEKEKRSIGQLNQVAGLEDDGRVKKDGGGWWWYTSRMTGKGCDNACCYLTIFEDHKHHQTFLLFRVQLVLGRRGSAETHLPGGDCSVLQLITRYYNSQFNQIPPSLMASDNAQLIRDLMLVWTGWATTRGFFSCNMKLSESLSWSRW